MRNAKRKFRPQLDGLETRVVMSGIAPAATVRPATAGPSAIESDFLNSLNAELIRLGMKPKAYSASVSALLGPIKIDRSSPSKIKAAMSRNGVQYHKGASVVAVSGGDSDLSRLVESMARTLNAAGRGNKAYSVHDRIGLIASTVTMGDSSEFTLTTVKLVTYLSGTKAGAPTGRPRR
jgi:hypothetical protein